MASTLEAEAPHNSFDNLSLEAPLSSLYTICDWSPQTERAGAIDVQPIRRTILVLDFGSQTSHLILRRIRALGVFAELLPCTTKVAELPWKPKGIIFSGGVKCLDTNTDVQWYLVRLAPKPIDTRYDTDMNDLSYGCQEIAWRIDSSNVVRGEAREYGHADVTITKVNSHADRLFAGLGDGISFAGIAHEEKPIFGLSSLSYFCSSTPRGTDLLFNFSVNICGAQPNWKMGNFVEIEIARIRDLVGPKALVIGGVSGGVDSTVGATLMREAIGDRFIAIGINNGCMRLNEFEEVKKNLRDHLGINLTVVDAGELFLSRLAGVTDPEKKRKIIGSTFIDVFEKEAIRIEKEAENTPNSGKVEWFLQGTLYPDVISVSSRSRGEDPQRQSRLIEPLRLLFVSLVLVLNTLGHGANNTAQKDEVRAIGRQLGIHESLVNRHPFPGPGIAIRILGDVTKERVEIARKADNIFINMIKEAGLYDQMSQAFAGLDTSRSVGVFGDMRVWGYIVILRAVRTKDFMSAEVFNFDNSFLQMVCPVLSMICKELMAPLNLELRANTVVLELQSLLALLSWNRRHDGILASVGWEEE
ncbi:GMP synthase (glutamine-hydrolyzing) [Metarhizium anisopliae]|nr:GMP synthase (glutamine-hydrolyzing) [Metarhizium anisopliae]